MAQKDKLFTDRNFIVQIAFELKGYLITLAKFNAASK